MARFKPYSYDQLKLVPVSFERQILPGTFEATLSRLIDEEIDLSVFEARYRNDEVGAPAYDPAILLNVILYASARAVTSSREIARLCREHVRFMAMSAVTATPTRRGTRNRCGWRGASRSRPSRRRWRRSGGFFNATRTRSGPAGG